MTKKVTPDGRPWSGPVFNDWTADDAWVQNERWAAYAEGRVHLPGEPSIGPLAPPGVVRYRLMLLRCSEPPCGALVGEVWAVQNEWQSRPFMWAETGQIADRTARPPTVRVRRMILDSVTADFMVGSECARHGWRGIRGRELIALTPKAGTRLAELGKSLSVDMPALPD